ncbi:MAG: RNA polymerase sigma factor [Terriglobia bacterium]
MDAQVNQTTDHDLMTEVARGNLASMSEIYRHRHRSLFRFFFRMTGKQATAEDLVHEVFLRMIRYRHTYQTGDGFEAWMYRIARNAFADQTKKHRLEVPAEEGLFDLTAEARPSAFEQVSKKQDLALLYRALRELPEDKRELIILSRFQGLSCEQIGELMGAAQGTVKVRVFRAMKEMGKIFLDLQKEKAS